MFFKLLSALENYNISRPKGELKRMTQENFKDSRKKRPSLSDLFFYYAIENFEIVNKNVHDNKTNKGVIVRFLMKCYL